MSTLDEAIAGVDAPPPDELDMALSGVLDVDHQAARQNLIGAGDPDGYARARELGALTNIPPPVVQRNRDQVEMRARLAVADQALQTAPTLAAVVAENKDFASTAADDLPLLAQLSNSIGRGWRSLKQTLSAVRMLDRSSALTQLDAVDAGETDPDNLGVLAQNYLQLSTEQRAAFRAQYTATLQEQASTSAARVAQLEAEKRTLPAAAVAGEVGSATTWSGALRAFAHHPVDYLASTGPESLVTSLPGMVAAVPASLAAGPAGAATAIGGNSALSDLSSSILQVLSDSGIDITDPAAITKSLQDPALQQRVLDKATRHAGVVGAFDALSGGLAGKLKPLLGMAVQPVLGAAGEAGGELAAGDSLQPGNILAEAIGELAGAPAEVASASAHRIGAAIGAATARHEQTLQAAGEALQDAQKLQEISKHATASKLRKRAPDLFQQFMQRAIDESGTAPDTLYVNGQLLAQSLEGANVDPTSVPSDILGDLAQAVDEGGDVQIPTAQFAAHLAGTPAGEVILQHVRTAPEGMSAMAAQAVMRQQQASLEQEFADAMAPAPTTASAAAVETTVREQLGAAAERFTPDAVAAYAAMHRDFFTSLAAQLGVTPEEAFRQHAIRVQGDSTGEVFEQPAYHGSPHSFDAFDLSKIGTGEGAQVYGHGLYFAESPDVAYQYRAALSDDAYVIGGKTYAPKASETLVSQLANDAEAFAAFTFNKGWNAGKSRQQMADMLRDERMRPVGIPWSVAQKAADLIESGAKLPKVEKTQTGAVYTVDIPDDAVERMLNWDVPLNEQSPVVQQAFRALGVDLSLTGQDAYSTLRYGQPMSVEGGRAQWAGTAALNAPPDSAQRASQQLRAAGIPGIKYFDQNSRAVAGGEIIRVWKDDKSGQWHARIRVSNQTAGNIFTTSKPYATEAEARAWADDTLGRKATRNLVLFDDKLPKITHVNGKAIGHSYKQDARGAFNPSTNTIALLQNADLSTFLHESGHFFLETYARVVAQADAPAAVRQDFGQLLNWFGVKDAATWQALSLDQRRPYHEQFARGFEAYLLEGRAPTPDLQGIFDRFRAWLLDLYQSATALHVELTPEVRGVMDRMLAGDVAITPEEWAATQSDAHVADALARSDARAVRDVRWISNTKLAKIKELTAEAKARHNDVRKEVAAEVVKEPVYLARQFLARGALEPAGHLTNTDRKILEDAGMQGSKLSLPALKELYGDGPAAPWRYLPTGAFGLVTAEGGMHPDQVAELFGFTSGDHLVRALLEASPVRERIEGLTDQRMLERYGDMSSAHDIERAAEAAIAHQARARNNARELAAIKGATGQWQTLYGAAGRYAEQAIQNRKVRELHAQIHVFAERRATKAANTAWRAGNLAQTGQARREALVQNRPASATVAEREQIDSDLRYLRRIADSKSIDADYREQINALLERFDLRKSTTLRQLDKQQSLLEWVTKQEEQGLTPVVDPSLLDEARRQSYKEMTVREFRTLVDAVKNIEHLGRLKHRLLTAADQREFAAAVVTAEESIRGNARRTITDKIESDLPRDRAAKLVKGYFTSHRKFASLIRQMDGGQDGGALWELLVRPMNAAGDQEAVARERATMQLHELLKPLNKAGGLHRKVFIPEIGASLTKLGRLTIALNWGNETNRQRVMDGDRWSSTQVQVILDTLTKEDWDTVQAVWNHLESYWPLIADKEKRVTGVVPEKVAAAPVQTKFGEYRGGYYPIKYDPARSSRSEADVDAEAIRQTMQGLYTRATTRRGHTKGRVDTVLRPMRKDLGVLFEHVTQVTHDLAWHEYLIDANRLIRAGAIDSAIREHYGPQVLQALRETLRDVARGELPAQSAFEQGMNYLRNGATIAGLGWNLTTAALQPLGLTQSMVRIGPKWVGKGLARWLGWGSAHGARHHRHL